ncbi:hypothetical protein MMC07_004496 [Pseudocyphellaria aurata]|nr:hypothetical protein [Pseudocyphellaria aurata]
MVSFFAAPPALSSDVVSLYCTKDPLLDNLPVLIFYGPATTGNSTQNGSRIQAHIYSLAGFQSFPRLTISPSSPLYAAVSHLPGDQQGDQVCRGLAVSLLSYYAGMSDALKGSLKELVVRRQPSRGAPTMFDEMHAGELAARMVKIDDAEETINSITSALMTQSISWLDMDVVLPPRTIKRVMALEGLENIPSFGEDGLPLFNYGEHDALINLLGSPTFLPTSKLRRAPSRPTAHSKGRSLLKDQKISLRREMNELVDTEERYIGKLHELINVIAVGFRRRLGSEGSTAGDSSSKIVDRLFPSNLLTMLELNRSFYDNIQDILQQTENEAISDIEGTPQSGSAVTTGRKRDPTGIATFAKELLKWFPKFNGPYQEYMRASTAFPNILNKHLQDNNTNFCKAANEIGEQRLRSALIEPVQRLPRYSLFIDNMVSQLPASHPGLTSLLKARDIITDICALDTSSLTENNRTVNCLKNLVRNWPVSFSPRGRLVTAVDVCQLNPPYKAAVEGQASILLLFSEALVLLHKIDENAQSARGIIAEVERPIMSSISAQAMNASQDKRLIYQAAMELASLQLTESEANHLIWVTYSRDPALKDTQQQNTPDISQASTKVFSLLGAYERKSTRLCEEIARARMEDRYPETIRESDKWALRSVSTSFENLSILAAIWEANSSDNIVSHGLSRTRISVDREKSARRILAENTELDIVACITAIERGGFRLNVECVNGESSTDDVNSEYLAALLIQRIADLIRNQGQKLNASRISYHRDVLQTLTFEKQAHESRIRNFRPISPVKMISNLLGTGITSQPSSPTKPRADPPILQEMPTMLRPLSTHFKFDDLQSADGNSSDKNAPLAEVNGARIKDTFDLLEDTFNAYVVALRSRSGNVVGKVLRGRAGADELMVNELYNILVEDPSRLQAAAEVSVDILFAAFEKFLKILWREHMGPLLAVNVIRSMQSKFDLGKPGEFSQHFKKCLQEMTSQNKRTFAATIKLLSDLLDASGNDGDRGVLIASFAEALVLDGNPHDYITLLDRVVDDYDNLFEDAPVFPPDDRKSSASASNSLNKNRAFNTGSLSSNASSLRKKFGFGITRSKIAKNTGDIQQQPASLSKASLVRSRSTDTDTRMLPPVRPVSRDLPPLPGAQTPELTHSRPGSSHLNFSSLSTIGEGSPIKPLMLTKKKRRSSLSDLKVANEAGMTPSWSPSLPRQANSFQQQQQQLVKTLPRTPSPTKLALGQWSKNSPQLPASPQHSTLPQRVGSPQRLGSPERLGPLERLGSPERFGLPLRKENSPMVARASQPRKVMSKDGSDEAGTTTLSPKKLTSPQSGIPAPKTGLTERAWPPNAATSPKKLAQPSQKLRMQSPQKLRERLSSEQKSVSSAEASLQTEITKFGEELSAFKLQRSPTKSSSTKSPLTITSSPQPTIDILSTALSNLTTKVTATLASLNASIASMSQDVETSLVATERKARKLDDLYREANAENEALYERFNDELGKILKRVRSGNGVEEMRAKMVEAQGEVGQLKVENARLRREVVGLKSVVRDG